MLGRRLAYCYLVGVQLIIRVGTVFSCTFGGFFRKAIDSADVDEDDTEGEGACSFGTSVV